MNEIPYIVFFSKESHLLIIRYDPIFITVLYLCLKVLPHKNKHRL